MSQVDKSDRDLSMPNIEASPNPSPDASLTSALEIRIRQQEILAELGVLALQRTSLMELLNSSVRMAAEGLRSDLCKILEYIPGENRLLLRSGIGWEPGLVGIASVGADLTSPAGYALRTGKPVISNHLEIEERFRTPELLRAHGVRRAINVILQGDGAPFGILEVDSRSEGEFTEHDISFLQGAANVLGMAIERQRYEQTLQAALEHQQVLIKEINHRVKNSLQLVGSMFRLQEKSSDEPQLVRSLQEAYGRINAIARVHERLYRDSDVGNVDLGAYLTDVCNDLKGITSPHEIVFTAPEKMRMSTDRSIPVALLVVELVTNAAKHAYPEGNSGLIAVRLAWLGDKTISISVRDEGSGLPDGFDLEQCRGLGMTITRAFLQQSGATLAVNRMQLGTEFVVEVPAG
jgi:two-component sensor histidine kinase